MHFLVSPGLVNRRNHSRETKTKMASQFRESKEEENNKLSTSIDRPKSRRLSIALRTTTKVSRICARCWLWEIIDWHCGSAALVRDKCRRRRQSSGRLTIISIWRANHTAPRRRRTAVVIRPPSAVITLLNTTLSQSVGLRP